jgi:hypothetical protein
MTLVLRPISWRAACAFVKQHHRHNKPPRGQKFAIAVHADDALVGVVQVGRPIARALDDGLTAEITRSCTDGTANANSMLYGAAVRACKAMGYLRVITYTQADETGASLRAAGFVRVKDIAARGSWAKDSVKRRVGRDVVGNGGVARVLWAAARDVARISLPVPAPGTVDGHPQPCAPAAGAVPGAPAPLEGSHK